MSFSEQLQRFNRELEARQRAVFVETAQIAHESVQVGSPITGAPGQPVDTGFLRNSWQLSFPSATEAIVSTNATYAEAVEDGVGPHGPVKYGKSGVGGSHSLKMTVAAFQRVVEHALRRVTGGV